MRKRTKAPSRPIISRWWTSEHGYSWLESEVDPHRRKLMLTAHPANEIQDDINVWITPYELSEDHPWIIVGNGDPACHGDPKLDIVYSPLDEPGLHRTLASREVSQEGILEFVEAFGFLGRWTSELSLRNQADVLFWGESFDQWAEEIYRMRVLLELWDCYRSTSIDAAARLENLVVIARGEAFVYGKPFPVPEEVRFKDLAAPMAGIPALGDKTQMLRLAALAIVRDALNVELAEGTRPAINASPGSPIWLVPNDLQGALYAMFAEEVIGRTQPTQACAACGTYFLPKHGRQIYCDDRCKFKGYRQNKKKKEA